MIRLLLLLTSLLLCVAARAHVEPVELVSLAVAAADDCDCCDDDAEVDCCDWDFGACHATSGVAALPVSALVAVSPHTDPPEDRAQDALHLWLPRDNGPPPTPPPNA